MNATDIIETICDVLGLHPSSLSPSEMRQVRNALEDGEALAALGVGDEDQEAVENAHAMMK